jgi:hypothetical protein
MARDGERIVAGAIGNYSQTAVGISNLFTSTIDIDQAWSGAVDAISRHFPDLPLVGYEHGASLLAAQRAGFTNIGSLRVWVKG